MFGCTVTLHYIEKMVNTIRVRLAHCIGSVSLNDVEFNKVSSVVSLPAVALNEDNFNSIYSYLKSTK